MNVEVREARREDPPVLQRLMQLYLYDLGTIDGWDLGDDGLYGIEARIEGFWTDPNRRSLLVPVDGKPAGFALGRDGAHLGGAGGGGGGGAPACCGRGGGGGRRAAGRPAGGRARLWLPPGGGGGGAGGRGPGPPRRRGGCAGGGGGPLPAGGGTESPGGPAT